MRNIPIRTQKDVMVQALLVSCSFFLVVMVTNAAGSLPSAQSLHVQVQNSPFDQIDMYPHNSRLLQDENALFDSCSICENLNVPFLPDKYLPFLEMNCSEFQSQYFGTIPKNHTFCNNARKYEVHCCDKSSLAPRYTCEENVRSNLFDEGYNVRTPPISQETGQLEINTFITHWYVEEMDIQTSSLRTFMQIELSWNDPRLSWDASDPSTCVSFIDVYASHEPEKNEIWIPVCLLRQEIFS